MVHFILSKIGFNCGHDKEDCSAYPQFCTECVKTRLEELGLEIEPDFKIVELESEEKRLQMHRELIWNKFLDVLNIKQIILISKKTGLPALNYPLLGSGFDLDILTGFLQANITFSKSEEEGGSFETVDLQFYEFNYRNFFILLTTGDYLRICLILDKSASDNLKNQVIEFLNEYERLYQDHLEKLLKTGELTLDDTVDFIIESFNIELVFPNILSHTISPDILENIQQDKLRNAILKLSKEILSTKKFFFINNLLDNVKQIVNIDAKVILYEIYLLLEMNVIIPTTIESVISDIKTYEASIAQRLAETKNISDFITKDVELTQLADRIAKIDVVTAEAMIKKFISLGAAAEKASIYHEAHNEFKKALLIAWKVGLKDMEKKVENMIKGIEKKMIQMELDFNINAAEKAEKKKDYIECKRYYHEAIDCIEKQVIDAHIDSKEARSKIKKLKKQIEKLQ
jgi:hypothetical protein